jgi:hypothetical protein
MPSKPYTLDGIFSETASKHTQAMASIDWRPPLEYDADHVCVTSRRRFQKTGIPEYWIAG